MSLSRNSPKIRLMKALDRQQFEEAIQAQKWFRVRTLFRRLEPVDVAELILSRPRELQAELFRLVKKEKLGDVFSYFSLDWQEALLQDLQSADLGPLMDDLSSDDRTRLFASLDPSVTARLLSLLPPEEAKSAKALLAYPDESVGRVMTTEFVALHSGQSVQQALKELRQIASGKETLNVIYIVDKEGRLLSDIRLGTLVLSDPKLLVDHIEDRPLVTLTPKMDQEEALKIFARYDRLALPVVDRDNHLVGMITHDDILDVASAEATEDFHKAAALAPLEASYPETSVWALFQKRIGWLLILVFVNLLSAGVIEAFEETLAAVVTLALFIPLLIGSGGNTGSQSATLMVRALAIGDVKISQWWRVLAKELFVGLSLGFVMGLASGVLGFLKGGKDIFWIVSLSMVSIVLVANLVGVLLPFVLTRFKIDPAVASSPLITTIADASGLLIYFSIATSVLAV